MKSTFAKINFITFTKGDSMSFQDRLAGMQDKAKEQLADYKPGGFTAIPDSEYIAKVAVVLDETKPPKKLLMAKWTFILAEGELEGRQAFDNTVLEDNPIGLRICRERVEALGYEWPEDELAKLEEIFEDINNRAPSVTIRLRGKENDQGYYNYSIRIREVHDMPAASEEASQQAAEDTSEGGPEAVEAEVNTQQEALVNFCTSQGIDGVTTEHSVEEITEAITAAGFTFKETELSDDEITLLKEVGLENTIEAKPAPAVVKKAAPALSKKAPAQAPAKKPAPLAKKKVK
jgi:hypothetical protein